MANQQSIKVRKTLKSLLSDQFLNSKARETGFVIRRKKISPVHFFWTLVLGFGVGTKKNISTLRRAYQRSSGVTLVPSSFYDRFNASLVKFLRAAIEHALNSFSLSNRDLPEAYKSFKDILIADSTLIVLNAALAKLFKGVRTNISPASAKLHSVFSVTGKGKSTVKLTSGSVHDRKKFSVNRWVKGKLLLFDLGYFHYQLFRNIVHQGGHFVTRLKDNADPVIVGFNGKQRPGDELHVGYSLKFALSSMRRDIVDFQVEVTAKSRPYNSWRSHRKERFRVVAIRNSEDNTYHCYMTSIPSEILSAEQVGSTYRARWEIEMVFKELKSGYRLDEIESQKKSVVEAFIYSSVLTLIASRKLFKLFAEKIPEKLHERISTGRWWRIFSEYAQEILNLIVRAPKEAPNLRELLRVTKKEIVDPHTKRRNLLSSTLECFEGYVVSPICGMV